MSFRTAGLLSARFFAAVIAGAAAHAATPSAVPPLTRSEIEDRVRREAAFRLGVPADDLRVSSWDERTWPDRHLGCAARHGLVEPEPTPGFRFVLDADGRRQAYHTDRAGRIVYCPSAAKRLGPILR
jgi:hypothetical protein